MEIDEFLLKLYKVVDQTKAARRSAAHPSYWEPLAKTYAQHHGIIPEGELTKESRLVCEMVVHLTAMSEAHGVVDTIKVMHYSERAWKAYQKAFSVCGFAWGDRFVCQREKGHTGKHYTEREGGNNVPVYAESE